MTSGLELGARCTALLDFFARLDKVYCFLKKSRTAVTLSKVK